MKLEGRVAWVTGGGSGLGRAISARFAAEGARVAVHDVRPDAAEETLKSLPGSGHLALAGDVTDSASVAEIAAQIAQACGRIDVLVNNAGVDRTPGDGSDEYLRTGSITPHMSDAGWTRMLEIHLNGAFFCAREAVKRMLEQRSGSIINMSSIAGLGGMSAIHYSTAKAGLLGFTGSLETPMTANVPEAIMKGMIASTPLRRMGTADEIASAALFLASDESSFITGQWLSPNGGIFIG
jgi:3-oxoacyl-[acyl-carrier protein] reductase